MPVEKKITYLDTGVLISAFAGTDEVAAKAFELLDDENRKFVASEFLKIELIPKPTFNKQTEALEFYNTYFENTVGIQDITQELVQAAFELACEHGLGGIDAMHFQSAVMMNASEFYTKEKATKPFFRINSPNVSVYSIHQ